jgi:hypothetical protein
MTPVAYSNLQSLVDATRFTLPLNPSHMANSSPCPVCYNSQYCSRIYCNTLKAENKKNETLEFYTNINFKSPSLVFKYLSSRFINQT